MLRSRRAILGGLGAALTGWPLVTRHQGTTTMAKPRFSWTNWSGTQNCQPAQRLSIATEADALAKLPLSPAPIRPLGAGHSFSALLPTEGTLVATDELRGLISADTQSCCASLWAGTRLHDIGPMLAAAGQAMPSLPDIDYQSIGGAISTSTHGSGQGFGSLSSTVRELTLVTPQGQRLECDASQNADVFYAARTSLGALGLVTRVTLQNVPQFDLTEVSRLEPLQTLLATMTERFAANRHYEFFALPHSDLGISITTNESHAGDKPAGADDGDGVEKLRQLFSIIGWIPGGGGGALYDYILRTFSADETNVTRCGRSHEILTHPRLVRFREMEYAVPAEVGTACLSEVLSTIKALKIPVVFPIECRRVKADDAWLSMFYKREAVTISVHQFQDTDYRPYFKLIEPIFWKYDGRPHWGKIHSLGSDRLAALYPMWKDFQSVRRRLDPGGRMLNAHVAALFGAT